VYRSSSLSAEQRETAGALFEAGLAKDAVAAQLGVSVPAVGRLFDRWQVRGAGALVTKPNRRSFSFELKLEVVRRFTDGAERELATTEIAIIEAETQKS
jgi:transposase